MHGSSLFVKGLAEQGDLHIKSLHVEDGVLTANVQSRGEKKKEIRFVAGSSTAKKSKSVKLKPGLATKAVFTLPDNAGEPQNIGIYEAGNDEPIAVIELAEKPYLDWDDYGSLLKTGDDAVFWWTDGVRKIGRHRRPPTRPASKKIELWCARNEYEPVQLVVSPKRDMRLHIRAGELRHKSGHVLKSALSLFAVEYVNIQTPTDGVGAAAPWPDPLPPIDGVMSLKKNENQPLWILAYIPDDAPAGDYEGWIEATIDGKSRRFPIVVHVWDFTLPKQTHLQTAFGFYSSFIPRYHHFSDTDRLDEILEKYFQSFASHRISPYDPFVLSPIEVEFDTDALTARLDFTKFDRAYEYFINELGFNTFRLPVKGLGYGSFHGATRGKIGPYKQGSPQYEKIMTSYLRQLQAHLQKIGALDKAYIYWFDEPAPKDYPFVRETMRLLQRAAPKLTRMLTEQPEPELFGAVDLWCPISHRFQEEVARQRRHRGERFWWYICTNPKAPYPTLFIDHYAVELRTWIWQTWKYGIDGILVWSANYWSSANVFPWPGFQNPWADPMSYRSGGSLKPGEITYWGNGDGRFIYPPKQVFQSTEKCDLGPVSSIRWEMLREGIEDYEYLWLLRSLVERLRKRGGHARLLKRAEQLLIVPESITRTPTEFSKKPEPIFEHRKKAAEMIVKLQKVL